MGHIAILLIFLCTTPAADQPATVAPPRRAGTATRTGRPAKKCSLCLGAKMLKCPDCQLSGRPTGKARCADCLGRRRITCPDCNGSRGIACSDCSGTGREYTGRTAVRVQGSVPERVYRDCPWCSGTGMRHVKGNRTLPGPCSRCSRPNLARRLFGTIPCPTCKGTGSGGPCPRCKGTKRIECVRCKTTATTQPTTRPAMRPGGPPRLPDDFKAPSAKAAAKAYSDGIRAAEREYAEAIRKLRDSHRRKISALLAKAIAQLDAAMKLVTQAGDLDEAIKIRESVKVLKGTGAK